MITIVNYGMGNLGSLKNMFRFLDIPCNISGDANEIINSKKILLPGVGNFEKAIKRIKESGLEKILKQKVIHDNVPILGICLGMQLLMDYSEERNVNGLRFISGR